jgi:hypothetical protein
VSQRAAETERKRDSEVVALDLEDLFFERVTTDFFFLSYPIPNLGRYRARLHGNASPFGRSIDPLPQ